MSSFFASPPKATILAASAVAVSHTGDLNETVLATIPIPAGIMGLNGILRITSFFTVTANTNTKIVRARLGGLAGDVVALSPTFAAAAVTVPCMEAYIINRNSASSQLCRALINRSIDLLVQAQPSISTAVDTAVAKDLVLTGQLGVTTDTITLESYLVELLKL
jgi:hypothetical protein